MEKRVMTDERRRLIESLRLCGDGGLDCSDCIMKEEKYIKPQNDGEYTTCYDDLMLLAADELERSCIEAREGARDDRRTETEKRNGSSANCKSS
nr:MAG TPA: hypothetical protein [Caudoviricetes sp.]